MPDMLPANGALMQLSVMQFFAATMRVHRFLKWPARVTRKIGKVLRDTSAGPGLLIVEGQQYRFGRICTWKSEVPPRVGMVVEVEFDKDGELLAIRTVKGV
jgi:hypothetical protein